MAYSETKPAPCLICLDAPADRTVDVCQHSFCETCLKFYQEDNGSKSCPACKGQCRQTGGQAKMDEEDGKADGQTVETDGIDGNGSEHGTLTTSSHDEVLPKSLKCIICLCRGNGVGATKVCLDCKDIPMCRNCLQDHSRSKFTHDHVYSLLSNSSAIYSSRQDYVPHGRQLELFCKTCTQDICFVCLSLEHSDHDIKQLIDIIRSEVVDINTALEYEEGRLAMLESDEAYLKESKSTAEDIESTLIKSIEDHTETVIEQAITNKETLKKEVRDTFKVIGVFAKCLAAMPELLKASNEIITRVDRILHDEAELSSAYVEKLRCLEQDLDALKRGVEDYDKGKKTYKKAYENLCGEPMVFYPKSPNMSVGGFEDLELGPKCDAGGSCVCETCQKKVAKLPHRSRVGECRTKKTCTCGSCGSVFHHRFIRNSHASPSFFLKSGYCQNVTCCNQIASPYYI